LNTARRRASLVRLEGLGDISVAFIAGGIDEERDHAAVIRADRHLLPDLRNRPAGKGDPLELLVESGRGRRPPRWHWARVEPVRLEEREGALVAVADADLPVLTAEQVRDAIEATRR
jgi:hypothetical protein